LVSVTRPGLLHKSCPLCDSDALKRRWQVNGYTIVRCAGCSLVFVQNTLSREELAAYYASSGDLVYSDDNRESWITTTTSCASGSMPRFPSRERFSTWAVPGDGFWKL
jgi:hypothetical protein